MNQNNILLTGYAKLPNGITATELYKVVAVAVIIDKTTHLIKDIECSLVTELARNFVKELLVDESINDLDRIKAKLDACYHGSAKKAVFSALKIIQEKYSDIIVGGNNDI